jgi:hypothetical protein
MTPDIRGLSRLVVFYQGHVGTGGTCETLPTAPPILTSLAGMNCEIAMFSKSAITSN